MGDNRKVLKILMGVFVSAILISVGISFKYSYNSKSRDNNISNSLNSNKSVTEIIDNSANEISKNGPKGIICSLFVYKITIATGNAIKLPRNIENTPNIGSNIKPNINNSLTSPPPKHSLLNIFSPNHIIKYINKNKNNPLTIFIHTPLKPKFKNWTIIK